MAAADPKSTLKQIEQTIQESLASFQPQEGTLYFSFETMLQLFLYHRLYQPQKPVLPCELPFSQLYRGKGRLLLETGDAAQGEVALREALRWNPVDPEIVFELAEAFKLQKKLSAYLAKTRRAFDLAVTKEQLARCYRNWGYYFIEQKEYDNAAQLYFFSNGFAESEMVLHELLYINQMTGKEVPSPDQERLLAILEAYQIPLGPSPQVVDTALALAEQSEAEGQRELAGECRRLVRELTGDTGIGKK